MDISLDEYIRKNDLKSPFSKMERHEDTSISKFDRYQRDTCNSDDDDELMDVNMEMPKLVPIKQQQSFKQRVSVHERLGQCNAIATNRDDSGTMTFKVQPYRNRNNNRNLKRLNNGNHGRIGVQHRLNKNFVNPAIVARNNFTVNAINSFMEGAMKTLGGFESEGNDTNLISALATRMLTKIDQKGEVEKYNMTVQKEISAIQGKQLFYKCPGATVVSFDGPGLQMPVKVPHKATGMSLNQRFA